MLPVQDHPYRNICDLRSGAATSLIELEFASHTGQDADTSARVPSGLPFYTLKAQLRELELVFLNRFLQVRTLHVQYTPYIACTPVQLQGASSYRTCCILGGLLQPVPHGHPTLYHWQGACMLLLRCFAVCCGESFQP